jgi:hypothetical protein
MVIALKNNITDTIYQKCRAENHYRRTLLLSCIFKDMIAAPNVKEMVITAGNINIVWLNMP